MVPGSGSVPLNCTVNGVISATDWFATAAKEGAWLTGMILIEKLPLVLKAGVPLSVTFTLTVVVPALANALGVQIKSPLAGSIWAPVGPLTRL